MVSIKYGLGRHLVDVVPADRPLATKYCFIAAIVYIVLSYLVKVIVSLFLVRICSGMCILTKDLYARSKILTGFKLLIRSGNASLFGPC